MGCVSSCFRVEDIDEYMNPHSFISRNCPCLPCLAHNFLNLYISVFRRAETRSLPSSVQATTLMTPSYSHDNFLSEAFRSTPRPLPYDADPRYFRSRREKGSSHSHEESEPLRSDSDDADSEPLGVGRCKWTRNKSAISDKDSKQEYSNKYSLRILKSRSKSVIANTENMYILSDDDEDVCPTCLEEYTTENPKIVTKCSHHYHLSCIYEWMERSENCPVCGKVMEFNETP